MEWSIVLQNLVTALAAIGGAGVTGYWQFRNRGRDREHEKDLKGMERTHQLEDLSAQQQREHVREQRIAVQEFFRCFREQQVSVAEVRSVYNEQEAFSLRKLNAGDDTGVEWDVNSNKLLSAGRLARQRVLQAWEVMDLSLATVDLRGVSKEIGRALNGDTGFYDHHIFPDLDLGNAGRFTDPRFQSLLENLRQKIAELNTR